MDRFKGRTLLHMESSPFLFLIPFSFSFYKFLSSVEISFLFLNVSSFFIFISLPTVTENYNRELSTKNWKDNEQENYNSKREDLEEEDQREDERNVIL